MRQGDVVADRRRCGLILVDDEFTADGVVGPPGQLGPVVADCTKGQAVAVETQAVQRKYDIPVRSERDLMRVAQPQTRRYAHHVDTPAGRSRVDALGVGALEPEQHRGHRSAARAGRSQRPVQLDAHARDRMHASASRATNRAAARIGPTVWELDGPPRLRSRRDFDARRPQ
jgi:hypothetical protein